MRQDDAALLARARAFAAHRVAFAAQEGGRLAALADGALDAAQSEDRARWTEPVMSAARALAHEAFARLPAEAAPSPDALPAPPPITEEELQLVADLQARRCRLATAILTDAKSPDHIDQTIDAFQKSDGARVLELRAVEEAALGIHDNEARDGVDVSHFAAGDPGLDHARRVARLRRAGAAARAGLEPRPAAGQAPVRAGHGEGVAAVRGAALSGSDGLAPAALILPLPPARASRASLRQRHGGELRCPRESSKVLPMSKVIITLLATLMATTVARADDSEVCQRARSVMDAGMARSATPEACQRALDSAEEERWQLWLDMALAAEKGGDREQAVNGYSKFVDAADRRGQRLGEIWGHQRDDARTAIARLDTELLQKKARVTIASIPDGAEVTIVSGAILVPGSTQKTPTIHYFAPGSHMVRLFSAETKASREINFSVEAGQTLELKADLRAGAPTDYGIIEGAGPALRGQTPAADTGDPGMGHGNGSVVVEVQGGPDSHGPGGANGPGGPKGPDGDDDPDGPPQTVTHHSVFRTLGVVGVAAGIGTLAAGAVFLANGSGLDDEFRACAAPGSGCSAKAAALNALEHEADVQYTRSTVAFIVGGALVVGGVLALVLVDDGPEVAPATTGAHVTPWMSPDGAGLSATVGF
ncbi:MAG: hypothetical protein U1F43_34255 [Myxococcota bacterium]